MMLEKDGWLIGTPIREENGVSHKGKTYEVKNFNFHEFDIDYVTNPREMVSDNLNMKLVYGTFARGFAFGSRGTFHDWDDRKFDNWNRP